MSNTVETTRATPAGQGQDAPNVAGQGDGAPSTLDLLTAARQGHAEAIANHAAATERARRAAGQHREAEAARRALLARASAGDAVEPIELTRAGTAVAEAKDALDLASTIASGAATLAERAAIGIMHAEAEHLRAAHAAALAKQIVKAESIDAAFAILQSAIGAHDDARIGVMTTSNNARLFNQAVIAAAITNETLAKLEQSQLPRIGLPDMSSAKPVQIGFFAQGFGEVLLTKPYSVAGALRAALGIPAPKAGN